VNCIDEWVSLSVVGIIAVDSIQCSDDRQATSRPSHLASSFAMDLDGLPVFSLSPTWRSTGQRVACRMRWNMLVRSRLRLRIGRSQFSKLALTGELPGISELPE
jgi:hypothetical protein